MSNDPILPREPTGDANTIEATKPSSPTFGDDFIAFADTEEIQGLNFEKSKEEISGPNHGKGKGDEEIRGPELKTNGKNEVHPWRQRQSPDPESHAGPSRQRSPPPAREWDRGKRSYDTMANEYDDGYNKKQRIDAMSRKAPWADRVDWSACNNVAEMLHLEVDAFTKWISPSPVEDEIRGLIIEQIARAVTEQFPDAHVHAFGSYETKLYLPLGDIDLVILSESMAYSNKAHVLHALANTMRQAGITSTKVTVLAKTKVPLVKFITTHGRFSVDISINQANGITAGKMINSFISIHPALRSLVMLTKAFLSQRSMNEVFTGGLGSYSIVLLALNFLQMHPKIRRGEIDPRKNLGVLALEFFELYGKFFNYEETGISVRDGGTYFSKKQRGWWDPNKSGLLSIEDPSDPNNDVSSGSYNVFKVRASFAGAYGILNSTAYIRAAEIDARRNDRHFSLRYQQRAEDMSILATVMGITQETINHRRLVQELYDTKVLHRILRVDPLPMVIVDDSGGRSKANRRKEGKDKNVHLGKAEMVFSDEEPQESKSNHHHRRRRSSSKERTKSTRESPEIVHDSSAEEGQVKQHEKEGAGRYDIGQSSKRPKLDSRDTLPFTTDDDEDADSSDSSLAEEEKHYSHRAGSSRSSDARESRDAKRSYWLSKGASGGSSDRD